MSSQTQILTKMINGRTITIVHSGPLTKPDGSPAPAWYYKNPTGPEQISISPEVWEYLVKKGMHKDVISLNLYTGLVLEYLSVYVVLENMSQERSDALLELFEKPKEEANLQALVGEGGLTQTEVDLTIRRLRLEEAAEAMKEWKLSQRVSLSDRSGAIFKRFFQTLRGDNPIGNRRIDFFKAIDRTVKTGEKVFD